MKKMFLFLITLLVTFGFSSCNDDGYSIDDYIIDIATVDNPDESAYFSMQLDDGTRLWTAATNLHHYRPKTGQRILANFTILGKDFSNYDYGVKLNDARNILTKGIFNITPQTQDSIGNDPIELKRLWVGSDFLNIKFYFKGFQKKHLINLVYDASKTYPDKKVHLEFRHNAYNDSETYIFPGLVSFNLTSLKSLTVDNSLDLVIHVKGYDGIEKTYDVKYVFDAKNTVKEEWEKLFFDNLKENSLL